MADLLFCARYPFTSQAKGYVSEKGLELTSGMVEKAGSIRCLLGASDDERGGV